MIHKDIITVNKKISYVMPFLWNLATSFESAVYNNGEACVDSSKLGKIAVLEADGPGLMRQDDLGWHMLREAKRENFGDFSTFHSNSHALSPSPSATSN